MIVLIVDDNAFMRTILKDIVTQTKWADATIIEAVSGEEAIAMTAAQKPDLILLDVVMPGKDGMEVLKEIDPTRFPVVIVSSVGQEYIIDHAKSLGIKDYILKPVDPALVIETLDKLFLSIPPEEQPKA